MSFGQPVAVKIENCDRYSCGKSHYFEGKSIFLCRIFGTGHVGKSQFATKRKISEMKAKVTKVRWTVGCVLWKKILVPGWVTCLWVQGFKRKKNSTKKTWCLYEQPFSTFKDVKFVAKHKLTQTYTNRNGTKKQVLLFDAKGLPRNSYSQSLHLNSLHK